MSSDNGKKEEKGGFWTAFSRLFRGGSSAGGAASEAGSAARLGSAARGLGGVSPGLRSAGGLSALFASKAGMVGMLLGAATIAAGIGVIYNFIGSSSNPGYTSRLFQNSYLEDEAQKAALERARDKNSADESSLDMFGEQAKKDGLGGSADEAGDSPDKDASAEAPGGDNSAQGGGGLGIGAAGAGAPKLQAAPGFGSGGGSGGGSSMMQGSGGAGGAGGRFSTPLSGMGKASAMKGSLASRVVGSSKYAVPNFNKKGAYGQAKYAKNMSGKAAYSTDAAGAKTTATEAFTGETAGAGNVAPVGTGAGLAGAGISNGDGLKTNDPSLNSNNSDVPEVTEAENDSPWQKWMDKALYGMLAWAVLYFIAKLLGKSQSPFLKGLAIIFALAAVAAAAYVIMAGYHLWKDYGQKWMGIMYMMMGAYMAYMAIQAALTGMGPEEKPVDTAATQGKTVADATAGAQLSNTTQPIGTTNATNQLGQSVDLSKPHFNVPIDPKAPITF